MRRREFIALAGASVTWPFATLAQQAGRTYRVGGVSVSSRNAPYVVATFDELRRPWLHRGPKPHDRVAHLWTAS
jgi:putative ABC transport system substrate-binding protein